MGYARKHQDLQPRRSHSLCNRNRQANPAINGNQEMNFRASMPHAWADSRIRSVKYATSFMDLNDRKTRALADLNALYSSGMINVDEYEDFIQSLKNAEVAAYDVICRSTMDPSNANQVMV